MTTETAVGDGFDAALCQYGLGVADDTDALVAAVRSLLERAGPADLYVLPELLGNDPRLRDSETPAAETALSAADRETYHGFLAEAAASREAVVVGGSYNTPASGGLANRTPVATPDGAVRTYDKAHPTPGEREEDVRGGREEPPVVSHRDVTVGVLNCYDVEFPGFVRRLVDRGAEVLAVPSWTSTEAGYERVRRCAAARAVENQVFAVHVPVVGRRGDVAPVGRGAVYAPCDDVLGPHGTRLALPRDEPAAATCRLDIAALRQSRERAAVRPYSDALEVYADR